MADLVPLTLVCGNHSVDVYEHGAHVTSWKVNGVEQLFVSSKARGTQRRRNRMFVRRTTTPACPRLAGRTWLQPVSELPPSPLTPTRRRYSSRPRRFAAASRSASPSSATSARCSSTGSRGTRRGGVLHPSAPPNSRRRSRPRRARAGVDAGDLGPRAGRQRVGRPHAGGGREHALRVAAPLPRRLHRLPLRCRRADDRAARVQRGRRAAVLHRSAAHVLPPARAAGRRRRARAERLRVPGQPGGPRIRPRHRARGDGHGGDGPPVPFGAG